VTGKLSVKIETVIPKERSTLHNRYEKQCKGDVLETKHIKKIANKSE
jgi:hypothetical protein